MFAAPCGVKRIRLLSRTAWDSCWGGATLSQVPDYRLQKPEMSGRVLKSTCRGMRLGAVNHGLHVLELGVNRNVAAMSVAAISSTNFITSTLSTVE